MTRLEIFKTDRYVSVKLVTEDGAETIIVDAQVKGQQLSIVLDDDELYRLESAFSAASEAMARARELRVKSACSDQICGGSE